MDKFISETDELICLETLRIGSDTVDYHRTIADGCSQPMNNHLARSGILKPAGRLLARLMSGLSEEYRCAGWLAGCEYELWADLTGKEVFGKRGWGISEEEKEELRLAHEMAQGWIVWSDEAPGRTFLLDEAWQDHLASLGTRR